MLRQEYIHRQQNNAFEQYKNSVIFEKEIEKVYNEIEYKMKTPDFLGKTVKATKHQFDNIFYLVKELAMIEEINEPPIYIYEDYYYGVESYGLQYPWIELSAKTIQDLNMKELKFLLAREIYKISDGITYQKTIMEQGIKAINMIAPDELEKVSKISFYQWYRLANYSADNYGYLLCGNINDSIQAILKLVLNSISLAEQVDIKEFISQASEINKLDDIVSNYTKADESVPYAPFRIKSLLAYAISERGMRTRLNMCNNKQR